jgi:hypothetical protein
MKSKLIIIYLLLTSCSSIEYINKPYMPRAPVLLQQECSELELMQTNTVAELFRITYLNAELYHLCANNNHAWIQWYQAEQKIINGEK